MEFSISQSKNTERLMNKPSIPEMEKQIEDLRMQIALRREELKGQAIDKIEGILREYKFSLEDLFPVTAEQKIGDKRISAKIPIKYSNGKDTWTGRGRVPLWVKKLLDERNLTLEEFKEMSDFSVKN
jgi:DNA-binding protein H-NS